LQQLFHAAKIRKLINEGKDNKSLTLAVFYWINLYF
jgi:hypothetical protein